MFEDFEVFLMLWCKKWNVEVHFDVLIRWASLNSDESLLLIRDFESLRHLKNLNNNIFSQILSRIRI